MAESGAGPVAAAFAAPGRYVQGRGAIEALGEVLEGACVEGETIHNEPFEVYPRMVVDAMLAADAFGRQRRAVLEGEARLPAVAQ